jgi:hypothetical protein
VSGLVDLDGHPEFDIGMELDRYFVGPEGFDRLVHLKFAAIKLNAGLGGDRFHNIGRGDRAEELALGAGPCGDTDDLRNKAASHRFGGLAIAGVAQVPGSAAWDSTPSVA